MRIAVLSDLFPPRAKGGAERIAADLARQYVREDHDVAVLTTVPDPKAAGLKRWEGLRIYWVHAAGYPERWRAYLGLYNPRVIQAVHRVLLQERPDILHAHNVHTHLSYHTFWVAARLGIPAVITFHDAMAVDYGKFTQGIPLNDYSDCPQVDYRVRAWRTLRTYKHWYFPLRNPLIRWYLHHYTQARVAVSWELRRLLETNGLRCTRVIHNGLDPGAWRAEPDQVEALRQRLGLEGRKVVLFGGRLSFWKGGEQIVKALPLIARAVPEVVLLVLGRIEGYARRMGALAKALGVEEHLSFAGWLEETELVAAYQASDVVVVPSICFDVFPTMVLEAMAARKPVVATCFGGAKEAVVDGETGYIVNPLNVEALAQRIVRLLRDEGKARQMGEAGYQRLLAHFTIEGCARQYLRLFAEVLKRK